MLHSLRIPFLAKGLAFSSLFILAGCQRNLHPRGEAEERSKLAEAGILYQIPVDQRELPNLEREPSLPKALEYAFKASGEIEAAYCDWRAALERVPQAGALPDPRVDFGYLFNPMNFTSFEGIILGTLQSLRLMVSQEFPAKGVRQAEAEMALSEAKAAGERLRGAKLTLQTKVIRAYAKLALNRDLAANTAETLGLLGETRQIALEHYHSVEMETAADIQRAELEIDRAESDQRSLKIMERSLVAELNGLLNRSPESPFNTMTMPDIQLPGIDTAELLERATSNHPELESMRREIEAKGAAQTLAELQRRQALMLGGGIDDPLMPMLTASLTLPVNRERIHAAIEEALARRQATEARLRQSQSDVQSRLIMALAGFADAERVLADTNYLLIPKAEEILHTQQIQYGSGGGSFMDILMTQRSVVEFRRLALQAGADRVGYLAELEELAGGGLIDFGATSTEVKR